MRILLRDPRTNRVKTSAKIAIATLTIFIICTIIHLFTVLLVPGFGFSISRLFRTCGGYAVASLVTPFAAFLFVFLVYIMIELLLDIRYERLQQQYYSIQNDDESSELPVKKSHFILHTTFRVASVFIMVSLCMYIIAASIGYTIISQNFVPSRSGTLFIPGLTDSVTINHEKESNIIHIEGKNDRDVFFAQGWVTARERLWQYEFQVRIGRGTLAEVVGEPGIPIDTFSRTIGFRRAGISAWSAVSKDMKDTAEAYCDGINAYIDTNPPLPIEFSLLGIKPSRCDPKDAATWGKLMYWQQTMNIFREIDRLRALMQGTSKERVLELIPPYPSIFDNPDAVTIIQSLEELGIFNVTKEEALEIDNKRLDSTFAYIPPKTNLDEMVNKVSSLMASTFFKEKYAKTGASNNWVISGKHTATGLPFLANDPHMALSAPSTWLLLHLKSPNFNAFGSCFVGTPGVILGRNDRIAFGMTNGISDHQDLYVLKPNSDQSYIYNGQSLDYDVITETINIAGAPSRNISVKISRWGPVVNDLFEELKDLPPVSLRWAGLLEKDTSMTAFTCHWRAQNWEQFQACFKGVFGPTMNNLYADVDGNIGYVTAGRVPKRRSGCSGLFAVMGDTDQCEYDGYHENNIFMLKNPERGYIASSNNRVAPTGANFSTALDYEVHFRALRVQRLIEKGIASNKKFTMDDMRAFQADVQSEYFNAVKSVLPKMMNAADENLKQFIDMLQKWNGEMTLYSREATLFEFWIDELARLPSKELGQPRLDTSQHMFWVVNMLKKQNDPACLAQNVADCTEAAILALKKAVTSLQTAHNGAIPMWGDIHKYGFRHAILNETPLQCLASVYISAPGGSEVVNVADANELDREKGTVITLASPNYRLLADMSGSSSKQGLVVMDLGQDGNMLTSEYDEYITMFRDVKYFDIKLNATDSSWRYQQTLQPRK